MPDGILHGVSMSSLCVLDGGSSGCLFSPSIQKHTELGSL